MNILSVLNTCMVINVNYQKLRIDQIHPWVRRIFIDIMPTILFIKRRTKESLKESKKIKLPLISKSSSIPGQQSPVKYARYMQENGFAKSNGESPLLYTNTLDRYRDSNTSSLNGLVLNKRFSSYHDLILTNDKKRVMSPNGKYILLKPKNENSNQTNDVNTMDGNRNSLYNIDKLKRSTDILNKYFHNNDSDYQTKTRSLTKQRKLYSLETIKLTDRFLKVCKSVEYIANIIKAQAELDEVIFKHK